MYYLDGLVIESLLYSRNVWLVEDYSGVFTKHIINQATYLPKNGPVIKGIQLKDCSVNRLLWSIWITDYSNHRNTEHLHPFFIRILDSMDIWYSNGKVTWHGGPSEHWTIWTINRLFSFRFSDYHTNIRPFENRTQIYHLNTRSDIQMATVVHYSDPISTVKSKWLGFSKIWFL